MTATTTTAQSFLNGVKRTVGYGYAKDATVSTPSSTYTVSQLIALIETAQNARINIDADQFGGSTSA